MAAKASCAIYVTEEALQKRYPCKNGKMLGCSDVDIEECDEQLLQKRTSKILCNSDKIVLGTIAFLDVKWKGQANVIKAIAHLKKQGITNVFYEMVGLGTGDALVKLAKKLNVADKVKILGAKNHEDIFRWLDSIDIYVQPSYQEGLCRAIVEAMSRAAPVICSDVGGNFELIDKKYLFKAGDDKRIAELIEIMLKENIEQSIKNFQRARKYEKRSLESKRLNFLQDFMRL
jgi:glycosyltransferase involved in cell wall biosynthesis